MANMMRITDKLMPSPWVYWASMAVLWSWLLTVILSLVLTAVAKRIASIISQQGNKGVLKSASVGMVRVSVLVDWLTSFGQKPIVLLSIDSIKLHLQLPVGEEGHKIQQHTKEAASRPPFLTWLLEVTMSGNPLWPILHGMIVVLRIISPLFRAFGVTFSRLKVKITVVDGDDNNSNNCVVKNDRHLSSMEVYVSTSTVRLIPDTSIPHGLSLIFTVYSFSSPCSSSNGLSLVTVDNDVLKLDMNSTSKPLSFFLLWSLFVDGHNSSNSIKEKDDGDGNTTITTPRAGGGGTYFVLPVRTGHILLPRYISLTVPPLAMIANEEALLQLIERIQSCSILSYCQHDILSPLATSEIPNESFVSCSSSRIGSQISSVYSEDVVHSLEHTFTSSSPSLLPRSTGSSPLLHQSIPSRKSRNMLKIVSKLVPWMKVNICFEELKAKLVMNGGSMSIEAVLDSLVFYADGVQQSTPSCQFGCSSTFMSIRTRGGGGGGGTTVMNQDIGEERIMFTSQVLKATGFTDFISSNHISSQISGCISSPSVVVTDKDVDIALGFIPIYNALCRLHVALKDSGKMLKSINNGQFDKATDPSTTTQLEIILSLTFTDIKVKALTTRRSGAPPLEKAEGGGTAKGDCYDFDPAVVLFYLPESRFHWSQDGFRSQPVSITLGIIEGSFQLSHRPLVPWLHLASLEMIIRQDPHTTDITGVVMFPNVTINALSLQLDWTPPAIFVFASLLSSLLKSCVEANISSIILNPRYGPLNYARSGNVTGNDSQQSSSNTSTTTISSSYFLPCLRDAEQMAACFSCNFSSMGSEHSSGALVVANVFDVTVYIPRAPLNHKAGDLTEDSTLRWLDEFLSKSEWKNRVEDWACECITVEHARIGVPIPPITPIHDGESSSRPPKTMTRRTIEINTSFTEITVGFADFRSGSGCFSSVEGWCGKQFTTKPTPYLSVDKFAVRKWYTTSNAPACVDVMSDGIRGTCTPDILNRVFDTSQGITLAVWLTMLMVKRSRAQSSADIEALDKNLSWDSEIALQYWSNHWQSVITEGNDAPSGDTLIRLNFCDVNVTANFPSRYTEAGEKLDATTANVRARIFGSDSAPEHFLFDGIRLSLRDGECEIRRDTPTQHHELVSVSRLSVKSTLQSFVSLDSVKSFIKFPDSPQMLISQAFYEIRARVTACGTDAFASLPESLSSLVLEPMGFLVEAWDVKLSLEKDDFVAKAIEHTLSHADHTFTSIKASGGRWHPAAGGPSGDFHRLFWKPPFPSDHYNSSDGLSPSVLIWGESIWLRLHSVRFTVGDDPMEDWLDALAPVWLSHLADQEMISKLRDWPSGGGAVPLLMERRAEKGYICKARDALTMRKKCLVEVKLSNLSIDISPPLNGRQMCASMLRKLGRHFSTSTRICLVKTSMKLELEDISIYIRRADRPLVSLPHLEVIGDVLLVTKALQTCDTSPHSSMMWLMDGGVLFDIKCNIGDVSFNYCPAALAGIEELALTMHTLCPPCIVELIGQDVAWWDMCRALVDGQVEVLARNTSIYLSKSHRTASVSCHRTATHCLSCGCCKRVTLQSAQNEETILVKVAMAYVIIPSEGSSVTLEAAGLSLELLGLHELYSEMVKSPSLIYTPPFLVAPIIKACLSLDWMIDNGDICSPFHSSGVVFHLSAKIVGIKDYKEGPLNQHLYEFGKDVSPLAQSLPSQLEINFFGVNLVSFWRWLHCFVFERSPPLPPKCMVKNGGPGVLSFARHIHGFHLKHLGVSKADIALLHTDPGDPFRRGIRLSLQSGFTFAVVLATEKVRGKYNEVIPDPFETGWLVIPSRSKHTWTFSGLEVHVHGEGIEVRLVSHEAGPHGAFFVSAKGLHVLQSCGSTEKVASTSFDASGSTIGNDDVSSQQIMLSRSGTHQRSDRSWGSHASGVIIPDMSLFSSVLPSASQSRHSTGMSTQVPIQDNESLSPLANMEGTANKYDRRRISSSSSNHKLKLPDGVADLLENDESSTSTSLSTSSLCDLPPTSNLSSSRMPASDKERGDYGNSDHSSYQSKACRVHFSRLLSEKQASIANLIREKKEDLNHRHSAGPNLERDMPYSTGSSTAIPTTRSESTSTRADSMPPPNPALPLGSAMETDGQVMGSEFLFEVLVEQPHILLSPFILNSLATLAQDILELVTVAIPMAAAPPAELLKHHHDVSSTCHLQHESAYHPLWGINLMPSVNGEEEPQQTAEFIQQRRSSISSDNNLTYSLPSILHKLFSIEVVALQVQLRDEEESRSCAVLGVRSAIIQGWVGLGSDASTDEEEDSNTLSEHLQYLAQRLLPTFQEAVTLTLEGAMLFVAPTDIDVAAGVMWLSCEAFSLSGHKPPPCSSEKDMDDSDNAPHGIKEFIRSGMLSDSSHGGSEPFSSSCTMFRPVVRCIPLITLQVLAQHGYPENHIIHLSVPPVLFEMDGRHQVWLFSVVSSVLWRGIPPELGKRWSQSAKRRRDIVSKKNQSGTQQQQQQQNDSSSVEPIFSSLSYVPSADDGFKTVGLNVAQAWLDLHKLRWDLHLLLGLKEEVEKVQRCTEDGGPPRVVVVALEAWASHVDQLIQNLEFGTAEAVIWLRHCVKESTKSIAQKPFTQIIAELKGLEIRLSQEESPKEAFFVIGLSSIIVNMSVYDDESGCIDVGVKCCTAHWLDSRKSSGTNKGEEVAFHSQPTSPKVHDGGLFITKHGSFRSTSDPLNSASRFSVPHFVAVLAPVTAMDLPMLSSAVLRRWTKKDDAFHLQAILASPSTDRMPVFWHMEILVFPLMVRLNSTLFDAFERYGDTCAAASCSSLSHSRKAKDAFLIPRASTTKTKSKYGVKKEKASAVIAKVSTFGSSSHHGRVSITEDGGYDSYDDQMLMWRAAPSLGGGGNSSSGTTVGILHSHSSGTGPLPVEENVPWIPFFKRPFILQHGRLGELNIFVSYTGGKSYSTAPESALEELDNFHLKLHPKIYTNKKWTLQRAENRIKRDAIVDTLKQVHRNFDNFGRYLAQRMGVKMRLPLHKALPPTDISSTRVENNAAMNVYGGKATSKDDIEICRPHTRGELPNSDLLLKPLIRDAKGNRSFVSVYSGDQCQLRLEDIPECVYSHRESESTDKEGISSTATTGSRSVVMPAPPMVSTTDEDDQWQFTRKSSHVSVSEAIEASQFLKHEKKSKGGRSRSSKLGRSLNLRRRFSNQTNS